MASKHRFDKTLMKVLTSVITTGMKYFEVKTLNTNAPLYEQPTLSIYNDRLCNKQQYIC